MSVTSDALLARTTEAVGDTVRSRREGRVLGEEQVELHAEMGWDDSEAAVCRIKKNN